MGSLAGSTELLLITGDTTGKPGGRLIGNRTGNPGIFGKSLAAIEEGAATATPEEGEWSRPLLGGLLDLSRLNDFDKFSGWSSPLKSWSFGNPTSVSDILSASGLTDLRFSTLSVERARDLFSSRWSMTSISSAWSPRDTLGLPGDRDRDRDRDRFKLNPDRFCGTSSLFSGSEGKGGKGGNRPEGGGKPDPPPPNPVSGNRGKAGTPPGDPAADPKSCAAAAETGGIPWTFGNLKPGGKMGVIPAMGLLTKGATGRPFFSASSINCSKGG